MPVIETVSVDVPAPPMRKHAIEAASVPATPAREAPAEVVSEAPRDTAPAPLEPAHHVAQVDISPVAPPIPTFELPPDMIQVETAPGKADQAMEAERPAGLTELGERPRRPRPPEDEPIPTEPLVQI